MEAFSESSLHVRVQPHHEPVLVEMYDRTEDGTIEEDRLLASFLVERQAGMADKITKHQMRNCNNSCHLAM